MNRRTFLTEFLKGSATILAAPTIVTHGLHLRKRLVEPVVFDAFVRAHVLADTLGEYARFFEQACQENGVVVGSWETRKKFPLHAEAFEKWIERQVMKT